jgi:NAD(P)-dependent dehydrogenase (short-subunit alcohol dehydrogenase family)
LKLSGQVALISGGDRGIGKGIALSLAKEGVDIAFNYRRDEGAASSTAAEIEALGRRALSVQADVSDHQQVKAVVARTVETFGRIDILVNNAGIASRGRSVADTEAEEMERLFKIHVMGAFYFIKEALPAIRKQKRGDIINISSVSPFSCMAGHGPYAVAKAGLNALSSVLAKEELKNNIRVSTIACGLVETDMGSRLVKGIGMDLKDLAGTLPFGRVCGPQDVGNLCVFLCSDEGGYISGHPIFLDGGAVY